MILRFDYVECKRARFIPIFYILGTKDPIFLYKGSSFFDFFKKIAIAEIKIQNWLPVFEYILKHTQPKYLMQHFWFCMCQNGRNFGQSISNFEFKHSIFLLFVSKSSFDIWIIRMSVWNIKKPVCTRKNALEKVFEFWTTKKIRSQKAKIKVLKKMVGRSVGRSWRTRLKVQLKASLASLACNKKMFTKKQHHDAAWTL